MFSFFKRAPPPARASSPPTRAGDDPWSSSNQDDYNDVVFSTSQSSSRQTSTSQLPTVNTAATAYPPLPSFSRPASSSAYPHPITSFHSLYQLLNDAAPHLVDNLADPVLPDSPELASLEQAIAPYRLPRAVKEAWAVHDGELSGSAVGGLFYGLKWMGVEEVETEWKVWRQMEEVGVVGGDPFIAAAQGPKTGRAHPYVPQPGHSTNDLVGVPGQSGFPAGWVRPVYSHPGWLPLITDHAGNYIGADLDPPPPEFATSSAPGPSSGHRPSNSVSSGNRSYGQPGQVIAFGREIDEKTVLFPGDGPGGWGRFLAAFVDDVGKAGFARLASLNGSPPLGRRGPLDVESGKQVESDSEDEGWSKTDGLGTDYTSGAQFGESGGDGTEETWVLGRKASTWLNSREGHGGTIGALAEMSRVKWRSVGVGSRAPAQTQPIARGPMRPDLLLHTSSGPSHHGEAVPTQLAEDEPQSAVTERPPPRPEGDLIAIATPESTSHEADSRGGTPSHPLSPGFVLQPPSPVTTRAPPSRRSSQATSSAGLSPQPPRPSGSGSGSNGTRRQVRQRPPPPPPAAIDLPTADELAHPVTPFHDDLTKSPEPAQYAGLPLHRAPAADAEVARERERHASHESGRALFEGEDGGEVELQAVVVLGEKVQGLGIGGPVADQPYV